MASTQIEEILKKVEGLEEFSVWASSFSHLVVSELKALFPKVKVCRFQTEEFDVLKERNQRKAPSIPHENININMNMNINNQH